MDATAAAGAWVDGWSRAWPSGDTDAVAALYAEEARFFSHPFREHQEPRAYAAWAFAEQLSAVCRFGIPVVAGDRAAVDWWAVIATRDGAEETVAGTSLLRFDADGRVVDQRDAWASRGGRHELPHWATGQAAARCHRSTERADAMLAILDGPSVEDGTACEIGMFHALMQSDPSKKGIVGLLTDIRGMRGESTRVNLFVQGAIEDVGQIVASIDEARDVLRTWR